MTERIDFYVLKSAAAKQRWIFACRLAEKAYLRDLRVVLVNDTLGDAQTLDELLWTFNDRSFVPHGIYLEEDGKTDPSAKTDPVQLNVGAAIGCADLLVNLSERLPANWQRYSRVAEIIDAEVGRRVQGRERFKVYRDQNINVQTHLLDETADI